VTRNRRRAAAWAAAAVVLVVVALGRTGGAPPAARSALRVQVVEAARTIPAGARIRPADLVTRRVPAAAADPHQLSDPAAAVGRRAAVGLPAGSPVMDAELASPARVPDARDVALRLDDLAGVPADDVAGALADVYVTRPGRPPRTRRVLARVLVVSASRSADGAVATLRLPATLVATAIAAEGAGQVRLVMRSGEAAP
jgi:Flp pilus assembly protein CpaB